MRALCLYGENESVLYKLLASWRTQCDSIPTVRTAGRLTSKYKFNTTKAFAHIGLMSLSKQHMRTYFGSECRILRSVRSDSSRHRVTPWRFGNAADSPKDVADAETVRRAKRAKQNGKLRVT